MSHIGALYIYMAYIYIYEDERLDDGRREKGRLIRIAEVYTIWIHIILK